MSPPPGGDAGGPVPRDPLVDPVPGLPPWVPNIDDEVSIRRLRRAIWLVFALGVFLFIVRGANRPADPSLATGPPRVPVAGFGETAAGLVNGLGELVEHCFLLAETSEQHTKGLKGRADLSGYRGMLFRFPEPTTIPFNMHETPMALSAAFFTADGGFVSAVDMAPCPAGTPVEQCPIYGAAGAYSLALHVPQGQLAELGVTEGSRLEVRGPCPPP